MLTLELKMLTLKARRMKIIAIDRYVVHLWDTGREAFISKQAQGTLTAGLVLTLGHVDN